MRGRKGGIYIFFISVFLLYILSLYFNFKYVHDESHIYICFVTSTNIIMIYHDRNFMLSIDKLF